MVQQFFFFLGLYLVGLLFGLLFKRKVPFPFLCITGFMWGSLIWVLTGAIYLVIGTTLNRLSMGLAMGVILCALVVLNIRCGHFTFSRSDAAWLIGGTAGFALISGLLSAYNLAIVTYDSSCHILAGHFMNHEIFSPNHFLSSRGMFVSVIQSASPLLGIDYLYAFQPVFVFCFLMSFGYLGDLAVRVSFPGSRLARYVSVLSTVSMASIFILVLQMFFIGNNFSSAVYLFLFVVISWLAIYEERPSWLVFSMLSLVGFSLLRTENVIFAMIFLMLLFSTSQLTYRKRLACAIPYLSFMILWYSYLHLTMEPSKILDHSKTTSVLAIMIAFAIFVLFSNLEIVKKAISFSHWLMLAAVLLALPIMFIIKPLHMQTNVEIMLLNTVLLGSWGIALIVLFALWFLSCTLPNINFDRIFSFGIGISLVIVLELGFFRQPYRLGWGDAANRILTNLVPIFFFYLQLRYGNVLFGKQGSTVRYKL